MNILQERLLFVGRRLVGGIMRKHRIRCQSRPRRTPLDETPVTGEYCDDGAATFDAAK
jgi:hypothetical protein